MTAANAVITRDLVVDHQTAHGAVRALRQEAMDVPPGTSTAIMGPSGCGKSTLLGLLAGLAVPDRGAVTIGTTVLSDLSEKERGRFRRSALGMVYQADNLLSYLTVEENVGLQRGISAGPDVVGDDPRRLLDRLGMRRLAERFPDQLSGGQRQRVAVARAIVHRPAVILADEPTGALDDASAEAVITLLIEVQQEIGATLIVVTHDPAVAAYADRIEHLAPPSRSPDAVHAG